MQDLGIEPANVSEAELKLARQLIGQQSAKVFDAASYVDEFKGRVEAAIQKKVEGKQVSVSMAPTRAPAGNVIDLMSALKASLGGSRQEAIGARKGAKRVERKSPARKRSRA